MSAELDLEITSEEAQERLDGSENNHSQVCKNVNVNFWLNIVFYALTTYQSSNEITFQN